MSRPYIIIYTSMSVDGRIGVLGERVVLSRRCDLERLHYFRSIVDAVMVGANTVLNDNPLLTPRYVERKPSKKMYRIVVDSDLKTPVNARVYDISHGPSIVVTSIDSCFEKKSVFRERGVEVVEVPRLPGSRLVDLARALDRIHSLHSDIQKILVEGGGYLIASLLKQRLVDEIYLVVTPKILGRGVCFVRDGILDNSVDLELVSLNLCSCGEEVVLNYKLKYYPP